MQRRRTVCPNRNARSTETRKHTSHHIYIYLRDVIRLYCAHPQLASGKTGFNVKNTPIYLTGSALGTNIVGINSAAKMSDIIAAAASPPVGDGLHSVKSKRKQTATEFDVIKVMLMHKRTNDITDAVQKNNSAARCIINPATKTKIPLQIDGMAMLYRGTTVTGLYDILIESLCRSIRLIENSVIAHKFLQTNGEVGVPKTFNFLPRNLGHYFSVVYFSESIDDGTYATTHHKTGW